MLILSIICFGCLSIYIVLGFYSIAVANRHRDRKNDLELAKLFIKRISIIIIVLLVLIFRR